MDFRVVKSATVRRFPNPEEKLRAVVDRAPEAEAFAERCLDRVRPFWNAAYGARRRLATLGVLLLTAWLFLHVMFGANGMVVYKKKRAELQNLRRRIVQVQQDNDRYSRQIDGLKNDKTAVEKEAREQMGYARPGEVVYVPPATAKPAPPANHTAKK
jgi:cell division protein FtsB